MGVLLSVRVPEAGTDELRIESESIFPEVSAGRAWVTEVVAQCGRGAVLSPPLWLLVVAGMKVDVPVPGAGERGDLVSYVQVQAVDVADGVPV